MQVVAPANVGAARTAASVPPDFIKCHFCNTINLDSLPIGFQVSVSVASSATVCIFGFGKRLTSFSGGGVGTTLPSA